MSNMEANFAEHRQLLQQLQALDYAPPMYTQLQQQLQMSQGGIGLEKEKLASLHRMTQAEHKDWDDIKNRALKRLWVKVKHPVHGRQRLTALEEQEEREYIAAYSAEQTAQARLSALEVQVAQLSQKVSEAGRAAQQHEALRQQLAGLYHRVFDGPTPAFPEEDVKEQAYNTAIAQYNQSQGIIINEKRALDLLNQAEACMSKAEKVASSATDFATMNSYGGEDDYMLVEKSEFGKAQRDMDQAAMFVAQAQQLEPAIPGLMAVALPKGNVLSDVFFDTLFSELAFRERADNAAADVKASRTALQGVISQAAGYTAMLAQQAQQAAYALENARSDLENTRRDIMMRHGGI